MKSFIFLPIPDPLKSIVASIVIIDLEFSSFPANNEYVYPWTAKASIFFTLTSEPLLIKHKEDYLSVPLCYVVGPRLVNDTINYGKKRRLVGISFKPGGFYRIMGIPVNLLNTENLDLHQMFGKETEEIEEKLKEAGNNSEILKIIENFLLKRIYSIRSFSLFDLAIQHCVDTNGATKIEQLASIAGISIRQFERKCIESLGISPKLFARLTRFAKAYHLKETNPALSWLNIALESGYYDQMHLIHDFQTFSGYSPSDINWMKAFDLRIMSLHFGKERI